MSVLKSHSKSRNKTTSFMYIFQIHNMFALHGQSKLSQHLSKLHQNQTFPLIYSPVHISKLRFRCQNNYPSLLLKFILQNTLSLPDMCLFLRSMQPKFLLFAFYFIFECLELLHLNSILFGTCSN